MALAGIILGVIEKPAGAVSKYSWLSKAKCSGINKHIGWAVGVIWLAWRSTK